MVNITVLSFPYWTLFVAVVIAQGSLFLRPSSTVAAFVVPPSVHTRIISSKRLLSVVNQRNKNDNDDGNDTIEDPSQLQREINQAVLGKDYPDNSKANGGNNNNDEDNDKDDGLNLYNAVPLFTGGIFTLFSIAATAYLYYAGLTGDDPLMGHPK